MAKVLVIGDTCKDIHVYGKCERMCPDAPVPVFVPSIVKENLGMAGNVYQNILSLGAVAVLKTNDVTIEKKRFVQEATNHMFLRVDENDNSYGQLSVKRVQEIEFLKYDAVIVSDYNKGFLSDKTLNLISQMHHTTFIDTKRQLSSWS